MTIVVRAQAGSATAFEMLVDRYEVRLLRHAWRMVGDRETAEDIVQDTFIAVWRRLPTLADPAAFRSWMYRIATRRSLDLLRARRPQVSFDDQTRTLTSTALDHGVDPAQLNEQTAQLDALRLAVGNLPPAQRAVWSLREDDQLSYDEIAVVLGEPVSTVRGRLARARRELAERMSGWR